MNVEVMLQSNELSAAWHCSLRLVSARVPRGPRTLADSCTCIGSQESNECMAAERSQGGDRLNPAPRDLICIMLCVQRAEASHTWARRQAQCQGHPCVRACSAFYLPSELPGMTADSPSLHRQRHVLRSHMRTLHAASWTCANA